MGDKGTTRLFTVKTNLCNLIDHPDNGEKIGEGNSQLLFGEHFERKHEDKASPWLYGTSKTDGYRGYVHRDNLTSVPQTNEATHMVSARLTHIYSAPSFKTHPLMTLGLNSCLSLEEKSKEVNGFVEIPAYGWVFKSHIRAINAPPLRLNLYDIAAQFLGSPYLYGGRSAMGLDCSALVQLSMIYHGLPCPRDSGDQAQNVGGDITKTVTQETLQRGDLVYFKGHVGIMRDKDIILNATARTMDTRLERLSDLINFYGDITAMRRVSEPL